MDNPQPVAAQHATLHFEREVVNTGGVNIFGIYNAPAPPPPPADRAQAEMWLFGEPVALAERRFSGWLDPRAGVVTQRRRPEGRELAAWCASRPPVLARLVTGPGGQGKTVLAEQLCQQMRADGWLAGLVALPPVNWRAQEVQAVTRSVPHLHAWAQTLAAAAHAAALPEVKGVLLVVDYADSFADVATALLDSVVAARHRHVPVRLLLLARHAGRWWTELVLRYSGGLVEPQAIVLPALQDSHVPDGHERAELTTQLWVEAVEAFTAKAITEGLTPQRPDPSHAGSLGRFATTLELYADALNHVLDAALPTTMDSALRPADPVGHLLHTHEYRQLALALAAAAPGAYLGPQPMRLLDVLCLRVAGGQAEAARALSALPELAALPAPVMRELVAALAALYPGATGKDAWSAPRPDRLADLHLLAGAADALSDGDWAAHVVAVAATGSETEAAQTVATMLRALSAREATTSHQEGARRLGLAVEALVTASPHTYLTPLIAADHRERFSAAMSRAVAQGAIDVDVVRSVDILLSQMPIPRYRTLGVHVSQRLIAAGPAAPRLRCHDLITYSRRLAEAGRDDEALSAAQEACEAWQGVPAESDADVALHAAARNNLGSRLLQARRGAEALAAIADAVRLRTQLSEKDLAALPELAAALTNQVACYLELGRAGDAVDAARQAVDALASRQDMAPWESYRLALAWGNLADAWRAAGRTGEAVAAAERALALLTELCDSHPAVFQAGLAAAQLRLATCLALPSAGRRKAIGTGKRAVPLARQAVEHFRSLFASSGEPYRADLAQACHTLAICQAQTSPSDALSSVDEALELLAAGDCDPSDPRLAACLSTKALLQVRARHTGAAKTSAHASVALYTQAQEQGLAVDRDLAAAQSNLAYVLHTAGDKPAAIAAAELAVHWRRGQEATSATLTLELADTLANLALCRAGGGLLAAAREAQQEAVDLYLSAAADHPVALARLRSARADLSRLRRATPRTPSRFTIRARFRRHWPLAPVRHLLPGVGIGFWATDLAPRRQGPRRLHEELLGWLDRSPTHSEPASPVPATAGVAAPITTSAGAFPLRLGQRPVPPAVVQAKAGSGDGGLPVSLRLASTLRSATSLAQTAQSNPALARLGAAAGAVIIALAGGLLGSDAPPGTVRPPSAAPSPPAAVVLAQPSPTHSVSSSPSSPPIAPTRAEKSPERPPTASPTPTPPPPPPPLACARSSVDIGLADASSFAAVISARSDAVWAVGNEGSRALAMRREGGQWSATAVPEVEAWSRLSAVAAAGSSSAWAVGTSGSTGSPIHTMILRWDGGRWEHTSSPSPGARGNHLLGVWASESASAWAVGNYQSTIIQPLIVKWDGAAWVQEDLPAVAATGSLAGISGTSGSDVWAVGHRATAGSVRPLILHFDGTGWAEVATPSLPGGELVAVKARTASDVWAVGHLNDSGHNRPLILRWDGTQWLRFPTGPAEYGVLHDVVPAADGQFFVTGHAGADSLPLAARWTGSSWDSPTGSGQSGVLKSASLDGQGRLLTVGWSQSPLRATMELLTC